MTGGWQAGPWTATHADGYEVRWVGRFEVEYADAGRVGRVEIEPVRDGVIVYGYAFTWVRPPGPAVDAECDVVVGRIAAALAAMHGGKITVVSAPPEPQEPYVHHRADLPPAGTPEMEAWLRETPPWQRP